MHSKLIALSQRRAESSRKSCTFYCYWKAKKDSVPKDVIDKTIRRGAGLDKDAAAIEDIIYEGMWAGGITMSSLTDNQPYGGQEASRSTSGKTVK